MHFLFVETIEADMLNQFDTVQSSENIPQPGSPSDSQLVTAVGKPCYLLERLVILLNPRPYVYNYMLK